MNTERFYVWLERNRGYSINTVRTYRNSIRFFDSFLIKNRNRSVNNCEKICLNDIDSFITNESKKKSIKTCNIELSAIKTYIRYCSIIGKQVMNTDSILRGKVGDKRIECLGDNDSKRLLDYFMNIKTNTKKQEILKRRNICICWLLIYTGLRVSELSKLKINQVGKYLQIIGKGNKLRTINLFEEDLKIINDYLNLRKDKSEYLFISFDNNSNKKKNLSTNSIEEIIKQGGKKAGLSERVRPHKLRHTFATNLLRSGVKLEHIQKLLGHNSISTTEIYLTIQNDEIRESQTKMRRF